MDNVSSDNIIRLVPTIYPENASNKELIWTVNNDNCRIDGDILTPIKSGDCIVTCTTVDGSYSASCAILINKPPYFEGLEDTKVRYGAPFNLYEGIRAIDLEDGIIDYKISPETIDTESPGVKLFTYTAVDSLGLKTEKTRTVEVLEQSENQAPYFRGITDIKVAYGSRFNLREFVKAIDPEEGEIEYTVEPSIINTNVIGLQEFVYTARDSQGLEVKVTRYIDVVKAIKNELKERDILMYSNDRKSWANKINNAYTWSFGSTENSPIFTVFQKLLPRGKYAISAEIRQDKGKVYGLSMTFGDRNRENVDSFTFYSDGHSNTIVYFCIASRTNCGLANIKLIKLD